MRRGEYGNQFKNPAMSGGPTRPGVGGSGGGTGGGYGGAFTRPMPGGTGRLRPSAGPVSEPAVLTRPMPGGIRPQGGGYGDTRLGATPQVGPQGGGWGQIIPAGGGMSIGTGPYRMPPSNPHLGPTLAPPNPQGGGGHQMQQAGGFTVGPQGGGMGHFGPGSGSVYGQNPFMQFLMEMFRNMGGQGGGFGGFGGFR